MGFAFGSYCDPHCCISAVPPVLTGGLSQSAGLWDRPEADRAATGRRQHLQQHSPSHRRLEPGDDVATPPKHLGKSPKDIWRKNELHLSDVRMTSCGHLSMTYDRHIEVVDSSGNSSL